MDKGNYTINASWQFFFFVIGTYNDAYFHNFFYVGIGFVAIRL